MNPRRLKPLKHRLVVRTKYLLPSDSTQSLGFVRLPVRPYLPWEIPQVLRRRLISFLTGSAPVPLESIATILPVDEAEDARRAFRRAVSLGLTPGEALVNLGIINRKDWSNVPNWCTAKIVRRGCACVGPVGTTGLIASSAGGILDNEYRVVRCSEVAAVADETQASGLRVVAGPNSRSAA
jgi:hypothetical protein